MKNKNQFSLLHGSEVQTARVHCLVHSQSKSDMNTVIGISQNPYNNRNIRNGRTITASPLGPSLYSAFFSSFPEELASARKRPESPQMCRLSCR